MAFADRIILNKVDLVNDEELLDVKNRLKGINGHCEIMEAQLNQKAIPLDAVLGLKAFALDRVLKMDPEFLAVDGGEHQHDQRVTSVGFSFEGHVLMSKLQEWLQLLMVTKGTDLFRYKGVLAVQGFDEPYVFQGVHMLFGGGLLEDESWPEGQPRVSRFIFIGKDLDRKALVDGFMKCAVLTGKLRFDVGQRLECCIDKGTFAAGTVIKLWDAGNPYRVRLDSGVEVWGPEDHDVYIRAAAARVA